MAAKILSELRDFVFPTAQGYFVQSAILFSAIAVATAIVISPWLDDASKKYAEGDLGVDQVITGTTDTTERYTVRKSVLDDLQ